MSTLRRRRDDKGWLTRFYDFIDERDIDKHFVSLFILGGTIVVTKWAMTYAEHAERPGLEVAAIIAAVLAPYSALQAAALAFYFKART